MQLLVLKLLKKLISIKNMDRIHLPTYVQLRTTTLPHVDPVN